MWLFLAYPFAAHLATLLHSDVLAAVALGLLIAAPLASTWRRPVTWLIAGFVCLFLAAAAHMGWSRQLMLLPPVLIPLSLMLFFARTLRSGSEPLVTQIARQMRDGDLPPELVRYTRHVTVLWVCLLAVLAAMAVVAAGLANRNLWSILTNVVTYAVLGVAFAVEYLFRRWHFRHLHHESVREFVSGMFKLRLR
jgi:uncharacterized membrane protein